MWLYFIQNPHYEPDSKAYQSQTSFQYVKTYMGYILAMLLYSSSHFPYIVPQI